VAVVNVLCCIKLHILLATCCFCTDSDSISLDVRTWKTVNYSTIVLLLLYIANTAGELVTCTLHVRRCHGVGLLLCPRPVEGGGGGGIKRWSASVVRPSVCLSDVAYIGCNSKTKRPRKTKLCTGVSQVTCDSHTDFKVKRSKVKVGRGHIVAAT